MGFRDDSEAVRARAEALERENRDLRQQVAALKIKEHQAREPGGAMSTSAAPWIVAGALVAGAGLVAAGLGVQPIVSVSAGVLGGVALIGVAILRSVFYVVAPNEALVLSGRRIKTADGRVVGFRVVTSGRVLKIPVVERADRISLEAINVELSLRNAYARGGIPLRVGGSAVVKISGDPVIMRNAIERFLGRQRAEIMRVARETLEGNLRAVVATLTPEQLREDQLLFRQRVMEEASEDLARLGLALDALSITTVEEEV